MDKDIFKERERSLEEEYFRKQDAKLLEKLRERGKVEEIAEALAAKLAVGDPELLGRIIALGVTLETGGAFLLAPLVQVAWGAGSVTDRERETVLRFATDRGIEKGSAAYAQLVEWLRARPGDQFFDTAIEAIKVGLSVLPSAERAERVKRIVDACREVAGASGGLGRLLGLGTGISSDEESILEAIASTLRAR
jgi:hypothetical protein